MDIYVYDNKSGDFVIDREYYSYSGDEEYKFILCQSPFAIGITYRSDNGDILYTFLGEDDGSIFDSKKGSYHSFWLPINIDFSKNVLKFLSKNYQKSPTGFGFSSKRLQASQVMIDD